MLKKNNTAKKIIDNQNSTSILSPKKKLFALIEKEHYVPTATVHIKNKGNSRTVTITVR